MPHNFLDLTPPRDVREELRLAKVVAGVAQVQCGDGDLAVLGARLALLGPQRPLLFGELLLGPLLLVVAFGVLRLLVVVALGFVVVALGLVVVAFGLLRILGAVRASAAWTGVLGVLIVLLVRILVLLVLFLFSLFSLLSS